MGVMVSRAASRQPAQAQRPVLRLKQISPHHLCKSARAREKRSRDTRLVRYSPACRMDSDHSALLDSRRAAGRSDGPTPRRKVDDNASPGMAVHLHPLRRPLGKSSGRLAVKMGGGADRSRDSLPNRDLDNCTLPRLPSGLHGFLVAIGCYLLTLNAVPGARV